MAVYLIIALIFLGVFALGWAIGAVGARADERLEDALREERDEYML